MMVAFGWGVMPGRRETNDPEPFNGEPVHRALAMDGRFPIPADHRRWKTHDDEQAETPIFDLCVAHDLGCLWMPKRRHDPHRQWQ